MSEHDDTTIERIPPDEPDPNERPRIRITDRRHSHHEEEGPRSAEGGRPGMPGGRFAPLGGSASPREDSGREGSGGPGGSSSGAAAGRSEAPAQAPGPRPRDLRAQLEESQRKAGEYLDHLQRLKAEFDNFRKRELKERTRAIEMAGEPLVRRLLEVLDEFDLALMAAEKKPDFEKFLHGVELVYAKLLDILRAEGVERIDAKGQPFDPTMHEALMQSADADGQGDGEPVVADILREGYTLRGRVVRPAGVKVARR